jgi:hypothetical protein
MTDEEIEIFLAVYRASGILNIRPLRVGSESSGKIHDRYGMNSQIDLSRQIRQKDTGIKACLRRRRAIRPGSAIAQAHRM